MPILLSNLNFKHEKNSITHSDMPFLRVRYCFPRPTNSGQQTVKTAAVFSLTKPIARLSYPKEFKLFNLNADRLRQDLFAIVGKTATKSSAVISLPNADGKLEQFEVVESSNFEPALQAQFPEIRAYSGKVLQTSMLL